METGGRNGFGTKFRDRRKKKEKGESEGDQIRG